METTEPLIALTIGLEPDLISQIKAADRTVKVLNIATLANFEKFLEDVPDTKFIFIACGNAISELQPSEIAQATRSFFVENPIFYTTRKRVGFDRKVLIKNGFTDAFLLPLDGNEFREAVLESIKKGDPRGAKIYRSVNLTDIQAGSKLSFDVSIYMPMNKKYIKVTASGEEMDKDRLDKLAKHNQNSVFIEKDELPKFYEYSATQLKEKGGSSGAMSETERKDRLRTAVRDLITLTLNDTSTNVATMDEGKTIVNQALEVIDTYILNESPRDWASKVNQTIGTATDIADTYSHTARVATFAALFAIGLKKGQPQILALAGLFHDIGLTEVSEGILNKPENRRSKDELTSYQLHLDASCKIIKERKLIVPEEVTKAILQHHERFDGTGYPKALPGARICIEAQILALADKFDYLTCAQSGKNWLTPVQAIELMLKDTQFDPELLKKFQGLFPKEN